MFALILLIIFSIGVGLFSTQNTVSVPLTIVNSKFPAVPLYLIVLGALLLGIFVSWFISLIDSFFSTMTLMGKNSALKSAQQTIRDLRNENHRLEVKNAELRGETHVEERIDHVDRVDTVETTSRPTVISRLKHKFS